MGEVFRLLHLSDLHLLPDEEQGAAAQRQYEARIQAIAQTIARWRAQRSAEVHAIAITGDIIDSSTVSEEAAVAILRHLVDELRKVSGHVPVLVVPGNHDRRALGLVRAAAPALDGLRRSAARPGATCTSDNLDGVTLVTADDEVTALTLPGCALPFVLNDSTFLDGGLFSAGGTVRSEDVLCAASQLADEPGRPVLWLLHHHLVPTPVTDLEVAGSGRGFPGLTAWAVKKGLGVLASLVSNVDREEVTMTAMGAGTVLTALHALQRPVLVLHGHKHFPTARVLRATRAQEGDVALVSAGSAGVTEVPSDLMELWPSFNVLEIDGANRAWNIGVETVLIPPEKQRGAASKRVDCRGLVQLTSNERGWTIVPTERPPFPIELEENVARYTLDETPNGLALLVHRRLVVRPESELMKREMLEDPVMGLRGSELVTPAGRFDMSGGTKVKIPLRAGKAEMDYEITHAVARNIDEAKAAYSKFTPYEWIGLPNRKGCATTILEIVEDRPGRLASAFASITDLATGQEEPLRLETTAKGRRVMVQPCPPRTLVRVYWRLPPR